MKSRETVVGLRRFAVEDKQRKVADLELMIAEFGRMAQDLDQQIATEEHRAGVSDVNHFSYPPFAKAAMQRRDNLKASVDDLEAKLRVARDELEDAQDLLKKAEQREDRRQESAGATPAAAEDATEAQASVRSL